MYKRNFRLTEFYITGVGILYSIFSYPAEGAALASTILSSAYIVSRAIFKRSRGDFHYSGWITSEFMVTATCCLVVEFLHFRCHIANSHIYLATVLAVFALARGWTKSLVRVPQIVR